MGKSTRNCRFCETTRALVSSVPAVVRKGALTLAELVRLKRDEMGSKQRDGTAPPVDGQPVDDGDLYFRGMRVEYSPSFEPAQGREHQAPVSRHSPEGFDEILEQREE